MQLHFRLNLEASRLLGRGDYGGAAACYKKIVDADPTHWGALLMLAHCHTRLGQHDEALAESSRAVEADPAQFLALRGLAEACVNVGDYHKGKLYVERALAIAPAPNSTRGERLLFFLSRLFVAAIRVVPRYRRRIPADVSRAWYRRTA